MLYFLCIGVVVGGHWCHDIHLIMFQQQFISLVHAAQWLIETIVKGIKMQVDYGAFCTVLSVVYPLNDGYKIMKCHLIYQSMLAMEIDCIGIMLPEKVESMHHWVVVSKETIDAFTLLGIYIGKTLHRNILVFFDESLSNHEVLHTVFAWILKLLMSCHAAHRVAHCKGWVDKNAVEAVQHLGVHAAHRRTYDEIGLFVVSHFA